MPARTGQRHKAPLTGAFFIALLTGSGYAAADSCGPPAAAELVRVRHVHDGDTLILQDNTRVRLIGINTPELGAEGQPAEPLAIRARDHLRQLLFRHDNQVKLLPGAQARDRHGRTLAYLWLPDDSGLTTGLLRQGLGWLVAIPPDTRFVACHAQAESEARRARRGVWRGANAQARDAASLDLREDDGFQRVRGRITSVSHRGGNTWIRLPGRFSVRIADEHLDEFDTKPDTSWNGRMLEVRGWVYRLRGELRVDIGHPANLQLD